MLRHQHPLRRLQLSGTYSRLSHHKRRVPGSLLDTIPPPMVPACLSQSGVKLSSAVHTVVQNQSRHLRITYLST